MTGDSAFIISLETNKGIGTARAYIVHGASLKFVWQRISEIVFDVCCLTREQLRPYLDTRYQQNAAVISGLLSSASHGLSPCIDAAGRIAVPNLPQQRRWPRHTVLQHCVLIANDDHNSAFVVDASIGGLGLSQTPLLMRGGEVQITLESGRRFDCRVAWSTNGRSGVRFAVPLASSDPLLAGGSM